MRHKRVSRVSYAIQFNVISRDLQYCFKGPSCILCSRNCIIVFLLPRFCIIPYSICIIKASQDLIYTRKKKKGFCPGCRWQNLPRMPMEYERLRTKHYLASSIICFFCWLFYSHLIVQKRKKIARKNPLRLSENVSQLGRDY